MPTCCTTAPMALASVRLMTAVVGMLACVANATKKASAILARVGNARAEKMGADVNTAKVRKKGQRIGESHAAICASVKEITAVTP